MRTCVPQIAGLHLAKIRCVRRQVAVHVLVIRSCFLSILNQSSLGNGGHSMKSKFGALLFIHS